MEEYKTRNVGGIKMKTILITGASSGIGRSTTRFFSEKGWNVIASMRSPEKETELNQLKNVMVVKMDVENEMEIQEAIQQGIDHFGKIDVLLNNAGYCAFGAFEAASEDQMKRQYEVNVFGVMRTTQAILPHFREWQAGRIINVSSIGGQIANPFLSLYQSSKFAIEGFSESLFYELAPHNIEVKLIEPGNIETNFTGRSLVVLEKEELKDYDEQVKKFLQVLMKDREQGNVSQPEKVAEEIYRAAIDQSKQLRYLVGDDAMALYKMRKERTDEEFVHMMSQMLG